MSGGGRKEADTRCREERKEADMMSGGEKRGGHVRRREKRRTCQEERKEADMM